MNKAKPYLQVAALVSSVLMVGAFIGCRSGAFQPARKPEPQQATPPSATPPLPAPEGKPTLMPGSKSANIVDTTSGLTPPAP